MNLRAILTCALMSAAVPTPALAQSGETEAPPAAELGLTEAYKREFAFLVGQKKQLQERLQQVEAESARREAARKSEIDALESRLLGLESRVQDAREALTRVERVSQSSADDQQLVDATIEQAQTTLAEYGQTVTPAGEGAKPDSLIAERFKGAVDVLRRLSSVRSRAGEFFAPDGKKVSGTLVEVGRIATFGVSDGPAGALAPVGGGQLKVWREANGATARALAAGERPSALGIYLYESLDERVDDEEAQTAWQHVASGGAIGWVIVGLGLLGLLLALLRALLLSRASSDTGALESAVGGLVREGRYTDALDRARAAKGAAARVLASVVPSLSLNDDDFEDALSEGLLRENRRIHRFAAIILVIAAVAPLLGLLGTVTGMISTFDVITKYGTGDPKMLSGGISTALVTTELGLIVAIPMLLLGNLLKGWGDGIESEAERVVLRVVNVHKEARHHDASPHES